MTDAAPTLTLRLERAGQGVCVPLRLPGPEGGPAVLAASALGALRVPSARSGGLEPLRFYDPGTRSLSGRGCWIGWLLVC